MRRFRFLCTAAAALFLFAGCAGIGKNPDAEYELVVLHTNDHHGAVIGKNDSDGTVHGGLAEVATFVKEVRAQNKNVLVLDAGDINTGMAVSNMFKAEPDIKAYNAIGYDAAVIGNHEFDKPLAVLKNQMKMSKFAWVNANIMQGNVYLATPYIIKKYRGFTVGIFGLTTQTSQITQRPDESLVFLNEIETAKKMTAYLRNVKKVDVVIELGHLGDIEETSAQNTSVELAQQVPGIDLIVDGHSHSIFLKPLVVNGIPIVTANERGMYVGDGVLKIKGGKVTDFTWKPVEITDKAFPPDPAVTALLKPYLEQADVFLKKVVMTASAEFPFDKSKVRSQETAIGNLLCDACVGYYKETGGIMLDFAIENSGVIKTALPAGKVTREQIMTMLPFESYFYVVTLKGTDVKKLMDYIASIPRGETSFPQVSKELRYTITYDADGKNGTVSNVSVSGKPIDDARYYRIGVNDLIAAGADGYDMFKNSIDSYNSSKLLNEVVVDYVSTLSKPVDPVIDGRITEVFAGH